jgi:hypothetical protein
MLAFLLYPSEQSRGAQQTPKSVDLDIHKEFADGADGTIAGLRCGYTCKHPPVFIAVWIRIGLAAGPPRPRTPGRSMT